MQHLLKIPFVRARMYAKAAAQFITEQEAQGTLLRSEETPERLGGLRTLLVDGQLIMQGQDCVRRVAAPLAACAPERVKHQGAWMVLAAGVSLGCDGYAPLSRFAQSLNFDPERMLRQFPVVKTLPYDDSRRVDTTVHRDAAGFRAYSKGEPEAILARCAAVLDGKERPLTDGDRAQALAIAHEMEAEGLSTLAFATHCLAEGDVIEQDMTFLGIVATGDLPDAEMPGLMEAFRALGIRPILTSALPLTGGAVHATGVLRPDAGIMDMEELGILPDEALRDAAVHADAFVGIDWRQKERLKKALRADGTVGTLTLQPDMNRLVLAMGSGKTPDVVFSQNDLHGVLRLLRECGALVRSYQPEAAADPSYSSLKG